MKSGEYFFGKSFFKVLFHLLDDVPFRVVPRLRSTTFVDFRAGLLDCAASRLHGVFEFIPIASYSTGRGQSTIIEHDSHECVIGNTLPLAEEPILGCRLKAKARVITGVSQNDNKRATGLAQALKPDPDKLRSNAFSPMGR